jgi:hypothetical protein
MKNKDSTSLLISCKVFIFNELLITGVYLNTGIKKDIQDMVIFSELENIPTISCKLDIIQNNNY